MLRREPDPEEQSKLSMAAMAGDALACAWSMFLGGRPDLPNAQGWTPLGLAACKGRSEAVACLLLDAEPTIRDPLGRTALMWAAACGRPEMVEALAKRGGAQLRCPSGATALDQAIEGRHVECVRILAPWTDLLSRGPSGRTPLMEAAMGGCSGMVEVLLCGSRLEDLDAEGRDARWHAKNCPECSALVESRMIGLSVGRGAGAACDAEPRRL